MGRNGNLSLCSYNLHGFNNGLPYLKKLCSDNDIIFVQEHWLLKSQLYMFDNINDNFNFFGQSSLDEVTSRGLLKGRPFGGVGVLWRKELAPIVKCYDCDTDGRIVVIKIDTSDLKMLIFGVYFPCDDHSKSYTCSVIRLLSYIEHVIDLNPGYKCLMLGDFNFECKSSSAGFSEFSRFMFDYHLTCCDSLDSSSCGYSYCHETPDHRSLIDHAFISSDSVSRVHDYRIVSDGANLSDHLSIMFNVYCHTDGCLPATNSHHITRQLRWDKGDLNAYYLHTGEFLNKIQHQWICADADPLTLCESTSCKLDLDIFYGEIVHCLTHAAKTCIPEIPTNALKHYWSPALEDLKHDSIMVAHNLWTEAGRPSSGDLFQLKKNAKYRYKLAIRDAANQFEAQFDDELLSSYTRKDFGSFWRTWKNKVYKRKPNTTCVNGFSDDLSIANSFAAHFSQCSSVGNLDSSIMPAVKNDPTPIQNWLLNIADVDNAVHSLKFGKASGLDGISAEHLKYAHPSIVSHLKTLFNLILLHGYVPNAFGQGVVVPLVKDRLGDTRNLDNYRAITVSCVISKVFSYALLINLMISYTAIRYSLVSRKAPVVNMLFLQCNSLLTILLSVVVQCLFLL